MNKERLLKLAALLEQDAKNPNGIKFDMNWWARPSTTIPPEHSSDVPFWSDIKKTPTVSCDTSGCAMGLAAVSGVFKDEGLTYSISGRNIDIHYNTDNRIYSSFEAAERFFDITNKQSYELFNPDYYGNTKGTDAELEVVRRINELVETGKIDL